MGGGCCKKNRRCRKLCCILASRGDPHMSQPGPFKWRHFAAEMILLCVRWDLRYPLSSRDLEEVMEERGLHVDHTTIYRWLQRYALELDWRCRPHLKTTTASGQRR